MTWSPLEYACHVRDVCRICTERLKLMLTTDDPHYPNWNQDETAVANRYGAHFTVETFARYFIHDPVHHLYDVGGNA